MSQFQFYIITFIVAFAVCYYNTANIQRFRNLFFLINRSPNVIVYSFMYGLIGVLLYLVLKEGEVIVETNKTIIPMDYVYSLGIGLSTRAVADINLFNLHFGGNSVPLGVKTFTTGLDKYFEERIDSSCFHKYSDFLKPYTAAYANKNLQDVKESIKEALKVHPNKTRVAALLGSEDFVNSQDVSEIMGMVLREFGESSFKRIFPL